MPEPAGGSSRLVRFGVFEVDLRSGELRKSGIRIPLQDQPFRTLVRLLERPGEVVTREEFRQDLWTADTFVDFEHGLNAAVKRLRDALGDSAETPRFIETLPRRGYRFVAPVQYGNGGPTAVTATTARWRRWTTSAIGGGVLIALVIATGLVASWFVTLRTRRPASSPLNVTPFTTYAGLEGQPAFSPDGRQVAFTWDDGSGAHLYVKLVGGDDPLRLTSSPGAIRAAWSPDGRQIAFLRRVGDAYSVCIVPALGGRERRLAETRSNASGLTWTGDGRFLVTVGRDSRHDPDALMLLSTETGATKELMPTRPAGFGDSEPALSPDGRTMAFVRRPATLSAGDIYLMSLAEGTLTKLVSAKWNIGGLDWTADGKAIVYAGGPAGGRLWRIAVSGGESSALPIGEGARSLSVARTGSRIAYSRASYDDNIWRVAGPTATKPMSPTRLIASTQEDIWPRYSPDGRSVLFVSNRSGLPELWTCDSEGRNCRTLAALGGTLTGTGEWSPDGKRVVFTRDASARSPELYIANVDEPVTRQLTNGALGSWSPDGRWIYFMLIRDDDSAPRGRQIWKIPVAGGPAVATTARGRMPKLSADGRFLYYVRGAPPNSIWRTDMTTGEETLVLDHELTIFNWVLWRQNLIYPRIDAGRTVIAQLDLASLRTTNIASLDHDVSSLLGLTVSPDGRWMLYGRQELIGSDIVLVENFR